MGEKGMQARLDTMGKFLPCERVVGSWDRLPRAVVKSLSLKGFNRCVDVTFGNTV